jgi:hypothetical protein
MTVVIIPYAAAAKNSRREADGFRTEGGSMNAEIFIHHAGTGLL